MSNRNLMQSSDQVSGHVPNSMNGRPIVEGRSDLLFHLHASWSVVKKWYLYFLLFQRKRPHRRGGKVPAGMRVLLGKSGKQPRFAPRTRVRLFSSKLTVYGASATVAGCGGDGCAARIMPLNVRAAMSLVPVYDV